MQSMWEQQRDNIVIAKNAHMAVVACERYQAAENGHKFDRTFLPFDDSVYTPTQLELFATNPIDFEFIENKSYHVNVSENISVNSTLRPIVLLKMMARLHLLSAINNADTLMIICAMC